LKARRSYEGPVIRAARWHDHYIDALFPQKTVKPGNEPLAPRHEIVRSKSRRGFYQQIDISAASRIVEPRSKQGHARTGHEALTRSLFDASDFTQIQSHRYLNSRSIINFRTALSRIDWNWGDWVLQRATCEIRISEGISVWEAEEGAGIVSES
jgi:hypothetical protein